MKKCALVLGVLFTIQLQALAQPLELLCEGNFPTYDNGFGNSVIETKVLSSRIFKIDIKKNEANFLSLFGEKTVVLTNKNDSNYFSFNVNHNVEFRDRIINLETFSINRITGKINSYYSLRPQDGKGDMYLSFDGMCKKAQRKF